MKKSLVIISTVLLLVLFAGCNDTSTTVDKPSQNEIIQGDLKKDTQPNTQMVVEVKVSKKIIEAGENIDFEINDDSNLADVEWRTIDGKLLSTKKKFNRWFSKEGDYTTVLTVTDINGNVATDTISIKVNRGITPNPIDETPNQPPVVKAKAQALDIMEKESIHLSDDGSFDPDGTIVKYEWRDMDGILLSETKNLDRVMYYWPQYDFNNDGTTRYVKTLFVTDDKGAVSSKDFVIIVHKKPTPNKLPTVDAGANQTVTEGTDVTLSAVASDSDGEIVSYTWKQGSVVLGNEASYTAVGLAPGTHIFEVIVTDNDGAVNSDTVNVVVKEVVAANTPPVAEDIELEIANNMALNFSLSGSDADGDSLTYEIMGDMPDGLTGTPPDLTYIPHLPCNSAGVLVFQYVVNDGKIDSTPATVVIKTPTTLNQAPIAHSQIINMNENDENLTIIVTASDSHCDTLMIIPELSYSSDIVEMWLDDDFNENGKVTFKPYPNKHGQAVFEFIANDGKLDSNLAAVTINVIPSNHAPTVNLGPDQFRTEGESMTFNSNAIDVDGTVVSHIWTIDGLGYDPLGNSFTLTVDSLTAGEHEVKVYVIDNDGLVSDTDSMIVTIVAEPLVTIAQALLGPLSNATFKLTKIDDGTVIAEGTTTAGDGTDVATAGLIQVTQAVKDALTSGLYLVEVTAGTDIDADDNNVWDAAPTTNKGTLHAVMSDSALKAAGFKVNILTEVVYQNIKDTLNTQTPAQIEEAMAEKAQVLLKDSADGGDVDGDGDIDSNDLIAWNPASDKAKLAIDYDEKLKPVAEKVLAGEDGSGEVVALFNTAPTATSQTINTNEDFAKAITLAGTDADGDTLTYAVVAHPTHGTLSGTAPNLTYTPNANYHGVDSFTFKVNDGTVDSATATIDINIASVDDEPTADAGADQSVEAGTTVQLDGSGSFTVDGEITKYIWHFTLTKPAGSTATFSDINAVNPTFVADVAGEYVIQLSVFDDNQDFDSGNDSVTITATPAPTQSKLLKTGQTQSFDEEGYIVADGSIKDDGYYQAGADRNFSEDAVNHVMIDNVSGLVWQNDSDVGSITKTWSGSEAINYCEGQVYNGLPMDLPTIEDLFYLKNHGGILDTGFLVGNPTRELWSNSTVVEDAGYAWVMKYIHDLDGFADKTENRYVRCVKKTGDEYKGDFVRDNAMDTVEDREANLIWQDSVEVQTNAKKTWREAIDYCEGLSFAGSDAWRLPNINELYSIGDRTTSKPAIRSQFNHVEQDYYWSSTTDYEGMSFLGSAVEFEEGNTGRLVKGIGQVSQQFAYVRCVRDK